MTTTLLARNKQKIQLEDLQRGVLEAYSRGLLSEKQAIAQLGLRGYDDLLTLLERADLSAWEATRESPAKSGIAEGYIHYWLNSNPKE